MKKLDGPILPPQSGTARSMVIVLHGYGASGDDLISLGEAWADDLPDTVFLSPNAPEVCEMFAGGFQWFSIRAIDERTFERERQIETVAPVLSAYIDEQLQKWGVSEEKLVVAGFSQGAMMAMYTMPRRARPCGGVIGYSGMLIDAAGLKGEGIVKMPVLAIHGDADEVVPPSALTNVGNGFNDAGFNVETVMRPGLGHGIDHFGLTQGLRFIKEAIEK